MCVGAMVFSQFRVVSSEREAELRATKRRRDETLKEWLATANKYPDFIEGMQKLLDEWFEEELAKQLAWRALPLWRRCVTKPPYPAYELPYR